jgi:hypothetical protein
MIGTPRIVFLLITVLTIVGTLKAQQSQATQIAGLRHNQDLYWKRISPTPEKPDGPVLYQIIFRSSAHIGSIPKIGPTYTLVDSGLTLDNNGNVVISGLTINGSTGIITFAGGQPFPGTGTLTGVNTGLGLTGGPITASGTLLIDTSVVPQLAAANTFTALNMFAGGTRLPPVNVATPSQGYSSSSLDFVASTYNLSLQTAIDQRFRWQAEPSNNNTNSTSGTLNLLFSSFGLPFVETGVSVTEHGEIAGQSVVVDSMNANVGKTILDNPPVNVLLFGGPSSGEGMGSQRTADFSHNQYGLDFYTGYNKRVSVSYVGSLVVDPTGSNDGNKTMGNPQGSMLLFGGPTSGEGISSNRTGQFDANSQYGLNFYTNYTKWMTIDNAGRVWVDNGGVYLNSDRNVRLP